MPSKKKKKASGKTRKSSRKAPDAEPRKEQQQPAEREAVPVASEVTVDAALDASVEMAIDEHEQALQSFFATTGELEVAGSMSLDLYRDQLDSRLMAEGVREYLSFALADEIYAVDIFHIKEIIKPPMITEVPRTEPVVLGILSLRGTIATVVDLRRRLGLEAASQTRKSRILIARMDDELVGLLVDEVRHVIRLKDENVEPPPGVFDRMEAEHIIGVGRQEGEMYTLLDLRSVSQIDRYLKS